MPDRRSCRSLQVPQGGYRTTPCASGLERQKKEALKVIDREEAKFDRGNSKIMQTFHDVTGEDTLYVDYDKMRGFVSGAKLWKLPKDTFGVNDAQRVTINSSRKLTQGQIRKTLLHEALHYTITRARRGNPFLSTDLEHQAMAMFGDSVEQCNHSRDWYDDSDSD